MKKESSFKDYKKHLKDLKKKGIVKNKKDEAKYWKKLLHTFACLKLKHLQMASQVQMHVQVYVLLQKLYFQIHFYY